MCGRTAFQMHPVQIPAAAGVPPQRANLNGYRPSHNVPPGRNQPVLFRKDDASSAGSASGTDCLPTASACASAASGGTVRSLMCMKWGLIPHWTKGAVSYQSLMRTSNARSETVHELPSFRSLVHKRRCVVLAEGYDMNVRLALRIYCRVRFFEWLQEGGPKGGKKPFYMTPKDPARSLLMFAGLYDIHKGDDGMLVDVRAGHRASSNINNCTLQGNSLTATQSSRVPCPANWRGYTRVCRAYSPAKPMLTGGSRVTLTIPYAPYFNLSLAH